MAAGTSTGLKMTTIGVTRARPMTVQASVSAESTRRAQGRLHRRVYGRLLAVLTARLVHQFVKLEVTKIRYTSISCMAQVTKVGLHLFIKEEK